MVLGHEDDAGTEAQGRGDRGGCGQRDEEVREALVEVRHVAVEDREHGIDGDMGVLTLEDAVEPGRLHPWGDVDDGDRRRW
ncbi:MAG: hypothetical protein U1E87_01150 [Alphaproteobacteria bacterium]